MEAKSAFGTSFGLVMGCLVALALFFVGGCVVVVTGVGWLATLSVRDAAEIQAHLDEQETPVAPAPVTDALQASFESVVVKWANVVDYNMLRLEVANNGAEPVEAVEMLVHVGQYTGLAKLEMPTAKIHPGKPVTARLKVEWAESDVPDLNGREARTVVLGVTIEGQTISREKAGAPLRYQ